MKTRLFFLLATILFFTGTAFSTEDISETRCYVKRFNNVTLEMSLKPFKKNDKSYIKAVTQKIFNQWRPLLSHADTISILLWTSDGSEILEYTGNLNQPFEWAKYIGNPNAAYEVNSGPIHLSLHDRAYTYMKEPPVFTYKDLKYIINTLKQEGEKITNKVIRVGATFDPGPEFAKSNFKYKTHPEICMANTMGTKSFVCSYAVLKGDQEKYASYPKGIPDGTKFGTFLGRQSNRFLKDMNFDYLWFSNGFGFGLETWNTVGAIFDGKEFHTDSIGSIRNKIFEFWNLFRDECPEVRIETRGTNLSTGIDLATDAVDLRGIYQGGFNMLPPPNSPWAALDGDFGLELTGYMSRISELPDERYLFRYYTHDPWWANSPWIDRYGRYPHDIYLPLSVSRINHAGEIKLPSHISFLTIDDSFGNMPDCVPNEVIPHILHARGISPDQAGPVVWVYPFDEYHDIVFDKPDRIDEVFYGDWFIRQAINDGFPLNTVVSTKNFVSLMKEKKSHVFEQSILVTPVPDAGSELEMMLMDFVQQKGKLIIYGPANHASEAFLEFMNLFIVDPLSGEFDICMNEEVDLLRDTHLPVKLLNNPNMSAGGIETAVKDKSASYSKAHVTVSQNNHVRDVVVENKRHEWQGGVVSYVRGINSVSYKGGRLLTPDDPTVWYNGASMMRLALNKLGYKISYNKINGSIKNPINCIYRNDNAYFFSGYVPNLTVQQSFKFPQGAPLFVGTETELRAGYATYSFPKSWHKECRMFVTQEDDGIVTCSEMAPVEFFVKRKIGINGLKNAKVRVYPGKEHPHYKAMPKNNHYPQKEIILHSEKKSDETGFFYEYENVTGQLVVAW